MLSVPFLFLATIATIVSGATLTETIGVAMGEAVAAIGKIRTEWQIDKYPNFMQSCGMHKSSWELMKHRFMKAIVQGLDKQDATYHISFMGSSVTAGHDSYLNQSYPILVGEMMKATFAKAGIKFTTSNNAIGNNPCLPYDACVATFAGAHADMVHWEQSYNCFDPDAPEQFVRQASFMPKQPIVVYSDSTTFNWKPEDCDKPIAQKNSLSAEEEAYIKRLDSALEETIVAGDSIEHMVSELNQGEFRRVFNRGIVPIVKPYAGMGIQGFSHRSHQPYMCQGPYVRDFGVGAASWHPTVIGHRLRAGHHAMFWLLAFREALVSVGELVKKGQSLGTIAAEIEEREKAFSAKHELRPETHRTNIPDNVQCYTAVQPYESTDHYLPDLVIGGNYDFSVAAVADAEKSVMADKWGVVELSALASLHWAEVHNSFNHRDHKYVMYGNKEAGPISFHMNVKEGRKPGVVLLCEVNIDFGVVPAGFAHMRPHSKEKPEVVDIDVYYTLNVPQTDFKKTPFVFDKDKAHKVPYKTELANFCLEMVASVGPGNHVLTLVATSSLRVELAYVLMP